MRGFIAYRGNSLLDNKPIVGIVTLETKNPKTGSMAQLWILREDVDPITAVTTKADQSICGNCTHKHNNGGSCYVQPFQAPLAVYKAFKRGNYSDDFDRGLMFLAGKGLRLGAYGDPAMLPDEVLQKLTDASRFHTGYTHQWKNKRLRHALKYCQASIDHPSEIDLLHSIDSKAKYFRVAVDYDNLLKDEIICPSDSGLTCIECKLCNGDQQNIVIAVHGQRSKRFVDKTKQIDFKQLA